MSISDFTSKFIGDKRRWRAYKARIKSLPGNYRAAAEAVERYLMYLGPADGESWATMFEDLADLFEQAAADGTPIRGIVGDDPIEFVETFAQNYRKGGWVSRERDRLVTEIKKAEGADTGENGETQS